jgi:hypothetical protein
MRKFTPTLIVLRMNARFSVVVDAAPFNPGLTEVNILESRVMRIELRVMDRRFLPCDEGGIP